MKKNKKLSLRKIKVSRLNIIESRKIIGGTIGDGCGNKSKIGEPVCDDQPKPTKNTQCPNDN